MSEMKSMKKAKSNNPLLPITVAVTGAIVGLVALKDEKNRKKVIQALTSIKNKTSAYLHEIQHENESETKKVEKKIAITKNQVKKVSSAVKDAKKKVKSTWKKE